MARLSAELRVGEPKQPHFVENELQYQISENSKPDSTIGWLQTDSDSNIKYRLNSDDFAINSTTGRIKTRHSLDREQKSQHNLKIELMNGQNLIDTANVKIDVLDV